MEATKQKRTRKPSPLTALVKERSAQLGLKPKEYMLRAVQVEIETGSVVQKLKAEMDERFAGLLAVSNN